MGKLYINYPMIESYQHLKSLPDYDYSKRKVPVSLQPGKKYKSLVCNETVIGNVIEFPHRVDDLLTGRFGIVDERVRNACCDVVFGIGDENGIDDRMQEILEGIIDNNELDTLKHQLKDWVIKIGYVHRSQTYWEYIREIFKEIIYHNICKANQIQNGRYVIEKNRYKEYFEGLNLVEILRKQNYFS